MIITIDKTQLFGGLSRLTECTNIKHQIYDLLDIAAFLNHRKVRDTDICFHLEKMAYPNGGTITRQSNKEPNKSFTVYRDWF